MALRLDLFLKHSRLIKRRTVAQRVCHEGRVEVNGSLARPGRQIAVGDTIKLTLGRKTLLLKVLALPTTTTKKAELPYQIVSEQERAEELL